MKNPNTCKICLFVDLILFISLKTVCENSGILVLELVVGSAEEEVKMLTFFVMEIFFSLPTNIPYFQANLVRTQN